MLFEFALFLILGIMCFVSPVNANLRLVLMILFVMLMALWVFAGFSGWQVPSLRR